ncbi:MAG: hypothetical protein AAGI46_07885 [Planctomycetota bacterium]
MSAPSEPPQPDATNAGPAVAVASLLADDEAPPVLGRTVGRLTQCRTIDAIVVLCWNEQQEQAATLVAGGASVVPVGPRTVDPAVSLVDRAQRWADGWRSGLLSTCPADPGWHADAARQIAEATEAALVYAVDPTFALLDIDLTDQLVGHAFEQLDSNEPVFFTPAPPGLVGLVVTREHVDRLALETEPRRRHPGRVLNYEPDAPRLDPIGLRAARNGPPWLTHAMGDFRIDTPDRIAWLDAGVPSDLEALVHSPPPARQDVTIELTTRRSTTPIWIAAQGDIDVDLTDLPDVAGCRVTLGNAGDPQLHPDFPAAVAKLRDAGATSVHVETDLLCDDATLTTLLDVDVVSVHLPAMTAKTYEAVMGTNALTAALTNVAKLLAAGRNRADGGPIVVPTFVKLAANVAEMEAWYDQWLRAAGSAVVRGPDALNLSPADDVLGLAAAPLNRTERPTMGRVVTPAKQAA